MGWSHAPVMERIMRRVEKTETCWNFGGANVHGYGIIGIHGKNAYTHRVVYTEMVGPIPDGMEIDHLCRNRSCCNPEHLEAVTRAENARRTVGFWPHAVKTHCVHGHEYTPENTMRHGAKKQRVCRICANNRPARRKGIVSMYGATR